jgi:hypothetical protein
LVEVCPLTLFLTFFKSNLKRLICFTTGVISFFLIRPEAYAYEREITLFPSYDVQLLDNNEKTKFIRLGVTESIFNTKILPCLFIVNQIPMLYSVFQIGFNCAFKPSERNNLSISLVPEVAYRNSNGIGQKKYAFGLGFADTYELSSEKRDWLASLSLNYKFWDNQGINSTYNLSPNQLIQIWGDVFDSNLTVGMIHNHFESETSNKTISSLFVYYLQSIPLEWRQIGGARNTASVEYNSIGIKYRKEFANTFIFGLGIAYWSLTFDGIRISGPLPDAYFGIDF